VTPAQYITTVLHEYMGVTLRPQPNSQQRLDAVTDPTQPNSLVWGAQGKHELLSADYCNKMKLVIA
jgi:hypothetical protein